MLTEISAHQRDDFPPHWDPPPRIGASRERPRIVNVSRLSPLIQPPGWRALFCKKLSDALGRNDFPMEPCGPKRMRKNSLKLIDELPNALKS